MQGIKGKNDGIYEECGPVKSNQLAVAVALVLRVGKVLADEKYDEGTAEVESPFGTSDVVVDAEKPASQLEEK